MLAPQFDSIDFQQDVWASFFARDLSGRQFAGPEALVSYLSEMAYNKVVDVFRMSMASNKRDMQREEPLSPEHYLQLAPEVSARKPSPCRVAMANETWEQLQERQLPIHRCILQMLRQRHTHEEIAKKLKMSVKSVQRFLQGLKEEGAL